MADKTLETTLLAISRLTNSVNGNPRFDLHTSDGVYRTQSDAACSYDVENIARQARGDQGARVRLTMTKAERVWKIETL